MKKIVLTEQEKNLIRSLYETDEPKTEVLNMLPKDKIKNFLFDNIKNNEKLQKSLNINMSEHDTNNPIDFLSKISHKIHGSFDFKNKHVEFAFPLGEKIKLDLSPTLGSHHDEHSTTVPQIGVETPFKIGAKFNLSSLFKK